MMRSILNLFFGGMIRHRTAQYLREITASSVRASRAEAIATLRRFREGTDAAITLGTTAWKETVTVPAKDMLAAHSLITGGTGAGKTRFALLLIKALIDTVAQGDTVGFGVLDPKGELYHGTLLLLLQKLNELHAINPSAAQELRHRIVILDFASYDPVSSYNILARRHSAEADFFAASRADLLLDLLPSGDGLSLGASALLRKSILLLSEFDLPITWLNDLLHDGDFRNRLVGRSSNDEVKAFFMRQFGNAPKQTIAALSRRLDALFSSEGVRLSLAGATAPDFRALQDNGQIVLINCFGTNISKSIRELLQSLVVSDIAQSIFARKDTERWFPWFCDEAQNFFITPRLRDQMQDVLTMSRSFGSFLCCLTQNFGVAVHDPALLHSYSTNIRWSFSMRGEPADCAFLKPALPVSGRKRQPQSNPFAEPTFYSLSDERTSELNAMATLPDRTGYFWSRPHSVEAIKIRTADMMLPSGPDTEQALDSMRSDPAFGERMSRAKYETQVAMRNRAWREDSRPAASVDTLAENYQRARGKLV